MGRIGIGEKEIYLFLAAGSENNLKPNLVMEAFLDFMGDAGEEYPLHFHRKDVYARNQEFSEDSREVHVKGAGLVSLESLGKEIV